MSFRSRLTIATALAVLAAILAASAATYLLVRNQLRSDVDDALRGRAAFVARGPLVVEQDPRDGDLVLHQPGGPDLGGVFLQAVRQDGTVIKDPRQAAFPVSSATLAAAKGKGATFFSDETVQGVHVRMLTVPAGNGYALQLVRSLDEVDRVLHRIGVILALVALTGVLVAAMLGTLVARSALRPVRRLTRDAELVAATQDLTHRIDVHGSDELSRLGSTFNTMLGALEESQQAQRQLVADASHELRTPLTSVRTNVEVLARRQDLPANQREALLADLVGQLEEMSLLVGNLVELSSEAPPDLELVDIRLDELTDEVVARAQRLAPQVEFHTELEPTVVQGIPSRLQHAIANLLDNAVKWSPTGGKIDVRVADGTVTVRDHGPGIDAGDLPHVFDRFYRAASARSMPGSGLGLAIVEQVAVEHGGGATVERADGGGTIARLSLPTVEDTAEDDSLAPAGPLEPHPSM